jgi:hypothetical protein
MAGSGWAIHVTNAKTAPAVVYWKAAGLLNRSKNRLSQWLRSVVL